MFSKRINGRIDINSEMDNGNIIVDEEEQRGTRINKFWFNSFQYMYKDIYPETYEDYAEVIACRLAKYLGVKSAVYDLASFNGNAGVITKNLVMEQENEEMLSGTEIITQVYTEYILPIINAMEEYEKFKCRYNASNIYEFSKLPYEKQINLRNSLLFLVNDLDKRNEQLTRHIFESDNIDLQEIEKMYEYLDSYKDIYQQDFIGMKNGIIKSNNFYDVWTVIEIYSNMNGINVDVESFMSDLINMFIFDIITSQGDRHADNWSIIRNNNDKSIRLCPLYDNSGICSLNRRKAFKNINGYLDSLNDEQFHEKKKEKVRVLLRQTIGHSKSSLKVDYIDNEQKNANSVMLRKFMDYSEEKFNDRIIEIIKKIDEDMLNTLFLEIEEDIQSEIPSGVKRVVKTVILTNADMINEIYDERKKSK